jgi:ribosomal protein S18 acetylase RimI-like enzyme
VDGLHLRPAGAADLPFLREMLYEAATWAARRGRPSLDEALADPDVARYLDGWPRDGETGLVAETWDGAAVGAGWWRWFTTESPGYGFVAPDIPELTLAVAPEWRRRGIGSAVLSALMQTAAAEGIPALSLSVDDRNGARRLYARAGFEIRARNGGAWTMVRTLG